MRRRDKEEEGAPRINAPASNNRALWVREEYEIGKRRRKRKEGTGKKKKNKIKCFVV